MFTYNRNELSLNGTWKFNPDPYMRCKQQSWWKGEGGKENFFPCFNIEGMWDIEVPGTWKTQKEELKWYDGDANYVKDFMVDEIPEDHEAFLCFDGVIYTCEAYLNGMPIGQHDWGYSPFQFRVTEYLREHNRLFVLVENYMKEDRVPGIRCDWNNDGGIINGVKLIFVPKVHIHNFRTETKLDGDQVEINFHISIDARVSEIEEDVTVEIPELNLSKTVSVSKGADSVASFKTDRSQIELWDTEKPKLYKTVLKTQYEEIVDEIGYREIKTVGHEIQLNGKPIRLYGIAVHSEFPETGRTATEEGIELMVKKARELGCNFLRCAHYPYADIFARAMDRMGMLWWEEVPVYWLPNIHEPHMKRLALGMLEDMIRRDWNRASLIFWSVSNECAGNGGGHKFTLEDGNYPYWVDACKLVRELDPSRLISSADSGYRKTVNSKMTPDSGVAIFTDIHDEEWAPGHPDEFFEILDVLGANLYVNKFGDNPTATKKFVDMLRDYNKPLMITEFGSMSAVNPPADKEETQTGHPKYHERILREGYSGFYDNPEIVGYVPWSLMDVRVPMHWRWYNAGSGTFAYGAMDNDYNEKHVFGVIKEEITNLKDHFSE